MDDITAIASTSLVSIVDRLRGSDTSSWIATSCLLIYTAVSSDQKNDFPKGFSDHVLQNQATSSAASSCLSPPSPPPSLPSPVLSVLSSESCRHRHPHAASPKEQKNPRGRSSLDVQTTALKKGEARITADVWDEAWASIRSEEPGLVAKYQRYLLAQDDPDAKSDPEHICVIERRGPSLTW
ncbi:hypothetical protein LX36DRAFT_674915 [Colletotrichum falcatum]|nr:hypothetical protein LX36DRAFT_674915 [Colletotrichum falcatum]